jgi:hypothetical protein
MQFLCYSFFLLLRRLPFLVSDSFSKARRRKKKHFEPAFNFPFLSLQIEKFSALRVWGNEKEEKKELEEKHRFELQF